MSLIRSLKHPTDALAIARMLAGDSLCQDSEVDWFVAMNNTGGTVDVWAVSGIDKAALVESPEGYDHLPESIPPDRLKLIRPDAVAVRDPDDDNGDDGPSGSIIITFRGH